MRPSPRPRCALEQPRVTVSEVVVSVKNPRNPHRCVYGTCQQLCPKPKKIKRAALSVLGGGSVA